MIRSWAFRLFQGNEDARFSLTDSEKVVNGGMRESGSSTGTRDG